MKRVTFGILALLSSLSLLAEEVTLKDIHGEEFTVNFQQISKAYFTMHEPVGFNQQIVNGDGSVAVINPVFEYAGKKIPFYLHRGSQDGICKHLGFSESHGTEGISKRAPLVTARMNENGSLSEIRQERSGGTDVISVIVCSHRS